MQENFNRCLALARGRYIKFLCADDLLEPYCVERLIETLEGEESVKLAACARRVFSDDARNTRVARYATRDLRIAAKRRFAGASSTAISSVSPPRSCSAARMPVPASTRVSRSLWIWNCGSESLRRGVSRSCLTCCALIPRAPWADNPAQRCFRRRYTGQGAAPCRVFGQAVPCWDSRRALTVGFPYGLVCAAGACCRLRR